MTCVPNSVLSSLSAGILSEPIGGTAIMHTHNTLTGMSQKYHVPMWRVPSEPELNDDASTVLANRRVYEGTLDKYIEFSRDLLTRIQALV